MQDLIKQFLITLELNDDLAQFEKVSEFCKFISQFKDFPLDTAIDLIVEIAQDPETFVNDFLGQIELRQTCRIYENAFALAAHSTYYPTGFHARRFFVHSFF